MYDEWRELNNINESIADYIAPLIEKHKYKRLSAEFAGIVQDTLEEWKTIEKKLDSNRLRDASEIPTNF